ncbi:histidine phosphatase family protein [Jannaschia sp. KMU-145]|uniref:histidine phosphatase family protein n=1 Tax=Jannaschia halovivens TaxID=3388667 RepID=UPI00396AFB48
MADLPPLYILRHGQTAWNVAGRMQGTLDSELTALGHVQAARQGAILRRAAPSGSAARVSPRGRAVATARLAGLDASEDARLAEIDMGAWQGRLARDVGGGAGVLWKFGAPAAEPPDALVRRVTALLDDLRGRGPTILVTHGVVAIALRARLAGRGIPDWDRIDDPQGVVIRIAAGRETVLT